MLKRRVLVVSGKEWIAGIKTELHHTLRRFFMCFIHSDRSCAVALNFGEKITYTWEYRVSDSVSLKPGNHRSKSDNSSGRSSNSWDFLTFWYTYVISKLLQAHASPRLHTLKVDRLLHVQKKSVYCISCMGYYSYAYLDSTTKPSMSRLYITSSTVACTCGELKTEKQPSARQGCGSLDNTSRSILFTPSSSLSSSSSSSSASTPLLRGFQHPAR